MSEQPEVPNLADFFGDQDVQAIALHHSAQFARARHADYDEVVGSHLEEFTEDERAEILSGNGDPAEKAYEIATRATGRLGLTDEILSEALGGGDAPRDVADKIVEGAFDDAGNES